MLNWKLSEGNAFDALSILEVKLKKAPKNQSKLFSDQISFYSNLIEDQIGLSKFREVINSIEYKKLIEINKIIFETTENARHYYINFLAPIAQNKERFRLKSEIQKKFFPKSSLNEFKI